MDDTVTRLLAETEWLHALTRRLVADPGLAADIAQETLVVGWQRRLHGVGDVRRWLATVARNALRQKLRRAQRRAAVEAEALPREPSPATADVVAKATAQREVVDAVLALREPYRTTVLLHHLEGLTLPAVAARLGVPLETVRARHRRGLQQLRCRLDRGQRSTAAWAVPILGFAGFRDAVATGGPVAAAGAAAPGGALAAGVLCMTNVKWTLAVAGTVLLSWFVIASAAAPRPSPPPVGAAPPAVAAATRPDAAAETAAPVERSAPVVIPAATAAAATWLVSGRVVDREHGGVVPAAHVELRAAPSLLQPMALVQAATETGADGRFELRLPPPTNPVTLHVRSPQHAETMLELPPPPPAAAATRDVGDLVLGRGTALAGRVFASDGRTPAACDLFLFDEIAGGGMQVLSTAPPIAHTDDDGRFALPGRYGPRAVPQWVLAVGRAGFGYRRIDAAAQPGEDRGFDLALLPTRPVTARCVDDAGEPVAGATVTLWPAFLPLSGMSDVARTLRPPTLALHLLTATSDAGGIARLPNVPVGSRHALLPTTTGGEYEFVASAAGHRTHRGTWLATEDAELRVELGRGTQATLRGRVVDAAGRGIAGARIVAPDSASTTSARDGSFVLGPVDVADGRVLVLASAEGYLQETQILDVHGQHGDIVCELRLEPPERCSGVVVDQDGAAIAGATVCFAKQLTTTDNGGRFAFDVAADTTSMLSVMPPNGDDVFGPMVLLPAVGPGEHRITLRRLLARATLRLALHDAATGRLLEAANAIAWRSDDRTDLRSLAVDGTLLVADRISAGRWSVQVKTRDGHVGIREFAVAPGTAEVVRWELPAPMRVTATVRGPWAGALPEAVRVWCDGAVLFGLGADDGAADGDGWRLPAGSAGTFRVAGAAADRPLCLCASSASFAGSVTVTPQPGGDVAVVLTMAPAATVRVRAAVPGALRTDLEFRRAGDDAPWPLTVPGDAVEPRPLTLPPGEWTFRASTAVPGAGVRERSGRFVAIAGRVVDVAIE